MNQDTDGSKTKLEAFLLHHEVEQFLYHEAALLDEWRLDEWLTFFTDDARYVVPTTDLPEGDPRQDLVFIDDDRLRLQGRVNRLKSRHAHREYPWSTTRRLITNVMIVEAVGDELAVRASCLVYRFRMGEEAPYVGHYEFRLKRVDGDLRIRRRRAVLDMEALQAHGALSIIF
ncbi:MAG: aromatic-ring-hydroxylating dioxygenase subunit beta [Dehalococcoidia bacterium]|jgi:p-cumate 2,3-dioxygenase beta subunit|nr:aromatic-ring-hydroxylating dioxygenase subunit beta [Dehalococcoidia bacterium]MDP7083668.1 aromatic-ring-hydroxylating dioxygenase subunit beta [Dehalococcoidia bacterium]MDP7199514.1 aromatic-ring-hydroxylating dioxygenase subunit beta [Dehalococcoidia bacterium]MDP7510965.1 aromatic-ring-hydroxylating dioxygenase subunit beta [Dehalococcoidia bacterium]HJN88266.1 aromatic-ring-hydroxylating dioxygenase subunit beta [Dehalococcoidia bacterium]